MQKKNDGEARESRLASGWTVEGANAPEAAAVPAGPAAADPDPIESVPSAAVTPAAGEAVEHKQMSNGMLVALGLLGGLYLMWAWVWLSWARYYASANSLVADASGSLGGVLQQIVFWVAPIAPIGWFLCAMLMNRGGKSWKLIMWVAIGAIVLAPLPMFVGGA